jgi:hypothetical protein
MLPLIHRPANLPLSLHQHQHPNLFLHPNLSLQLHRRQKLRLQLHPRPNLARPLYLYPNRSLSLQPHVQRQSPPLRPSFRKPLTPRWQWRQQLRSAAF